ncbi:hypothetical protein RJ639_000144 [Escallonia herrerae]|uniref:Uncharacterized protein n=1 Tax=Escallonia herrerae TaxID=1293975 RepID=A0AA89BHD7_9ASTE|nr:hypothetical protein RJ639_000144 [Escallonia herrerae]
MTVICTFSSSSMSRASKYRSKCQKKLSTCLASLAPSCDLGSNSSITLNLPSKQQGLVRYCASTLPSDCDNATTTLWCHEKLVAINAAGWRLTYEVADNNMGFKQYLSTIKLSPVDVSLIDTPQSPTAPLRSAWPTVSPLSFWEVANCIMDAPPPFATISIQFQA